MSQNLDFLNFLPSYLKNEVLTGLVSNLFNRFVSQEQSVYVAGRIGIQNSTDATIQEPSLERQENALIPGVYFNAGSEQYLFTFDDLINRLNTLDADTTHLRTWAAEQTFNYSPPVDYDKLINYTSYYWVGASKTPGTGPIWNPNYLPEYYVIANPKPTDTVKVPVRLATTRDINLYYNDRPLETFTLTFVSATAFNVTSNVDPSIVHGPYVVSSTVGAKTHITLDTADGGQYAPSLGAGAQTVSVCSFYITSGAAQFQAGDSFTLSIEYFTSSNTATLVSANPIGKGTITGISSIYLDNKTIPQGMDIDRVPIAIGDRILVKDQADATQNGIYIASAGGIWSRSVDAAIGQPYGSLVVFVEEGVTQAGTTWNFKAAAGQVQVGSRITFSKDETNPPSPVNAWQTNNFWIHRDDISLYENLGYSLNTATQAQRPIIEYSYTLQLNSFIDGSGDPSAASTLGVPNISRPQVKTRFNQLPQFDLFRYDGSHTGITSGIWFFAESPSASIDSVLRRRAVTTVNGDFVFGAGIVDTNGRLLYWSDAGSLKSIWRPGVATPAASTPVFSGASGKGDLNVSALAPDSDNQQWVVTAINADQFSVIGTRSGNIGNLTVGSIFSTAELSLALTSTGSPFSAGDSFTFSVWAPSTPRYIEQLPTGEVVNYPGGVTADEAAATRTGAWLSPARLFQNLGRQSTSQISYGDFLNHVTSVLSWQNKFTGSSFGSNNVRNLPFNYGLGGQIREFGSNFPLLISMLIQQNLSPITVLDFAQQQYNLALSSIDKFLINNLAIYLASLGSVVVTTIDPLSTDIIALEEYFETLRGQDTTLSQVFSDSTAAITNWPATLPSLGLLPSTVPGIIFDYQLNSSMIRHHDGHTSVIASDNQDFDRLLVQTIVTRSDGAKTPGVFSETAPSSPYARQLWLKPSAFIVSLFNVAYDTASTPLGGIIGQYWYNRATGVLRQWSSVTNTWVLSSTPASSLWTPISTSTIRNSLVLAVENKLYAGIHPQQQLNLILDRQDIVNSPYAELELAEFSSKYNYDTYAPNYDPGNAFSWNYRNATIPGLTATPATWFNLYTAYFGLFGESVIPTDRPDLQPWALLGFTSEPTGWAAQYAAPAHPIGGPESTVDLVATTNITDLNGFQVIDEAPTIQNQRVLLVGQTSPEYNGIWIIDSCEWSRATDQLSTGLNVYVNGGWAWQGTRWTLVTQNPVAGNTALDFEQIRSWKPQMWADISTAHPNLKLCVNVNTDGLIPPYVSPYQFASTKALLTSIPSGINLGYQFGDLGPVELVWRSSLEYGYGLARSYFRLYPLEFLDSSWGETYISTADNLRVERNLQQSLPSSKFLLHGERLNLVNSWTPTEAQRRFVFPQGQSTAPIQWTSIFAGTVNFLVTHTANTGAIGPMGTMGPSSTVFNVYVNGLNIGLIYEGVPFTFSSQGITYTNVTIDDLGIPFELGDSLQMTFIPDTISSITTSLNTDFIYGLLGCEGCVAADAPDSTTVITDVQNQPTYLHTPAQSKIFKGVGQWFSHLLRFTYIDSDVSLSSLAYRGWDVQLVHRLGALIRPDSLNINTSQGVIPDTGYSTVLKRSTNTEDLWITGLRVQLVQMGSRVLNPTGLYVPVGAGDDWIFTVNGYNSAHPQLDYYVFDTVGSFQDFYVLGKQTTNTLWKKYTSVISTQNTVLPLQITGIQNVVNFINGYTTYIQDAGFKINANDTPITDQETGRNLDWQLETEKLINLVYSGMNAGSAYVLNPFMNALYLQTPTGLMGRYTTSSFIDVASTQAAYDVTGSAIPINNLRIIRTDEQTVTYSTTPIFSAHVFIDQFEHAILFNDNYTTDTSSSLIFSPFLGEYLKTAYMSFTRQDTINGKPTFDGFYLNDDNVARNMVSSVEKISNFYDAGKTFNDPITAQHSTALLGFQTRSYFDNLDISDSVQLDFWRGMIHAKGTNLAVQAFTNYKSFVDASVDEYWAYKLATYGDSRERTSPEIKINPSDCAQNYTQLQFYSSTDLTSYTPLQLYTQIEGSDASRWFTIDDLGTVLRFDAAPLSEEVTVSLTTTFPLYIRLKNIYHNGDEFAPTITGPDGARIITANMICVIQGGTYTISGFTWLNKTKFSPIQLHNYVDATVVSDITFWHPAIGIHAHGPLETVDIITSTDPARYNYTTNTTNNPNYLALKPWADREVGRVWWDTSALSYIPYYDATIFSDRQTRQTRWGSLAGWASVDLYVWTESTVHPSLYNAQSAIQSGNSSIDASTRLSGTVGFTNTYIANRKITITPIAWSQAGIGSSAAHPSFGPSSSVKIYISGVGIVADTGRLADIDIVAGRNLGGWLSLTGAPIGEVSIGSTISYDIGSSLQPSAPVLPASGSITFTIGGLVSGGIFGTRIGQIALFDNSNSTNSYLRMMDSTGFSQDVLVQSWNSTNLAANSTQTFTFDQFGLQLTAARTATGSLSAAQLISAATSGTVDIYIRELVDFSTIIPLPDVVLSNNPNDAVEYGWKAWTVPTQAQLSADLISPNNTWLPYLGTPVSIVASASTAAAMADASNSLSLSTGITIKRYNSTWTPFAQLTDTTLTGVSNGLVAQSFTLSSETTLDTNRLLMYANGIQLQPATYTVSTNLVQLNSVLPEGTTITLIYLAYQPTTADLSFNPLVAENTAKQIWYKTDYQYTQILNRDSTGAVTGTRYYFWVTGKTDPLPGQSFNLVEAAATLTDGEDSYMLFSRMVSDGDAASGAGYDSCAIYGLGNQVTDTNAYKLRFLRDFTLRDDPEQLNLKNVHTEWTLIRQNQSTNIPLQLWTILTNAACGQDQGGNSLPSQVRIDYDSTYGAATQFGFGAGQIFAPSSLVIPSIVNSILNTSVKINIGTGSVVYYITALGINSNTTAESFTEQWFSNATTIRATMNLIWTTASPSQINEIFFNVLNDALANNYEMTDLFKTSMLTLSSSALVNQQNQVTQTKEFY